MELIDTHCHLDHEYFKNDREQVVERARAAGVKCWVNPSLQFKNIPTVLALTEQYEDCYAGVGVYPRYCKDWQSADIDRVRQAAQHKKVVAIGEIGLDYYRQHTPPEQQRLMFISQLELAQQLELPVIIHNRDATADLMPILTSWYQGIPSSSHLKEYPGVLHSFSANLATALSAIEMHFHIGIEKSFNLRNFSETACSYYCNLWLNLINQFIAQYRVKPNFYVQSIQLPLIILN